METTTLSELSAFITSVGFPIAVAIWLLVRGDKTTRSNTNAINNLANVVDNNTKVVEKLSRWDGQDRRKVD